MWLIYKSLTQVLIWQWRRAPRRSITYTIILVPSSLKVVRSIIGMLLCSAVLTSLSHSRIWAVWLSAQPNSGQSFQLRKDGSPCIVKQGQFKESEPVRGYLLVWSKIRWTWYRVGRTIKSIWHQCVAGQMTFHMVELYDRSSATTRSLIFTQLWDIVFLNIFTLLKYATHSPSHWRENSNFLRCMTNFTKGLGVTNGGSVQQGNFLVLQNWRPLSLV